MRVLLVVLVFFLLGTDTFSLDQSLAPGLSVKNAILYLIAFFLLFRIALGRNFKLELPALHLSFAVLIGYALLTWLLAALVVEYPSYDLIDSAIKLKSALIDYFIFFLVFFYGVRSAQDALVVGKAMLLAVVLANFVTVTDVLGILDLGVIQERDDGRVQGAIGESNQYAAFIIFFLPAMFAAAATQRGFWRLVWVASAMISIASLLMTVSRGAFVGLVVSGIWSVYLFRRYLSTGRILGGLVAIGGVVLLVAAAMSLQYGALLEERIFGQTSSMDISDASSGRTEIWTSALERMLQTPVTFLTGFGWDVYWTMPFRYSPHNHYLALWFNLGLPGLICGVALLALIVVKARSAVEQLAPPFRTYLIAFVIGTLALSVAVFFVDLYQPWLYFWAYTGLMMRIATSAPAFVEETVAPPVRQQAARKSVFGWVAAR